MDLARRDLARGFQGESPRFSRATTRVPTRGHETNGAADTKLGGRKNRTDSIDAPIQPFAVRFRSLSISGDISSDVRDIRDRSRDGESRGLYQLPIKLCC